MTPPSPWQELPFDTSRWLAQVPFSTSSVSLFDGLDDADAFEPDRGAAKPKGAKPATRLNMSRTSRTDIMRFFMELSLSGTRL
jgi:hypothetical protein